MYSEISLNRTLRKLESSSNRTKWSVPILFLFYIRKILSKQEPLQTGNRTASCRFLHYSSINLPQKTGRIHSTGATLSSVNPYTGHM